MGSKPLNKKPSLVDRLRQLRTATRGPSKATISTETGQPYVSTQPVNEHPDAYHRGMGPKKPMSNPQSQPYHPVKGLNLEELDSKLEQYAKRSLESADTETDMESDGPPGRETLGLHRTDDQPSTADTSEDEPERDPSWCLEPVASLQPPSGGLGSVDSCPVSPHDPAEDSKPSDFELFMREAVEAERQRADNQDQAPRPTREPPLNPFYSTNWDHQSRPPPKLAEIQEAADDDGDDDGDARRVDDAHAIPGDFDSERQALSSEASSQGGDAGLALPQNTLTRANTDMTGLEKRVTFGDLSVPRELMERRASAPSCAVRVKSPSRPVRKRKSIKQLIVDYIRPPRG
jgi:hypothetical protein